jgi:hypothetical protein
MAKKNVSSIESGAGFIGSLASKLVKRLRQINISDDDIYELVKEGEASDSMIDKIADVLAGIIQQAKDIFRLVVGRHKTTEEAVAAGKYDWTNENINSRNFPYRTRRPKGNREIVLIEFDYDPDSEQVIAEAEKQGLVRPDYEDALDFGEQFPEKQREFPIVFLHEPWLDSFGFLVVVVLSCGSSERGLGLGDFRFRWFCYYRFAFVRK